MLKGVVVSLFVAVVVANDDVELVQNKLERNQDHQKVHHHDHHDDNTLSNTGTSEYLPAAEWMVNEKTHFARDIKLIYEGESWNVGATGWGFHTLDVGFDFRSEKMVTGIYVSRTGCTYDVYTSTDTATPTTECKWDGTQDVCREGQISNVLTGQDATWTQVYTDLYGSVTFDTPLQTRYVRVRWSSGQDILSAGITDDNPDGRQPGLHAHFLGHDVPSPTPATPAPTLAPEPAGPECTENKIPDKSDTNCPQPWISTSASKANAVRFANYADCQLCCESDCTDTGTTYASFTWWSGGACKCQTVAFDQCQQEDYPWSNPDDPDQITVAGSFDCIQR